MSLKTEIQAIINAENLNSGQKAEVAGTAALVLGVASLAVPILVVPAVVAAGACLYEDGIRLHEEADKEDL